MKRSLCLIVLVVSAQLCLAAVSYGGWPCLTCGGCSSCGAHCVEPGCPPCLGLTCRCSSCLSCTCWGSCHAAELVGDLSCEQCCVRLKAAKKLGCRLHADFCQSPEILPALQRALVCDTCWEVRKAAAWSLALQEARTPQVVLVLYIASKLDPHYMVRDRATEALNVLLVCRRDCPEVKELFKTGDELIKKLKGKYKPTQGQCVGLFEECTAACGVVTVGP